MDVVERWVRHLRATGRKPNTIASYRSDVRRFRSFLDDVDLLDATSDNVQSFVDSAAGGTERDATLIRRFRSLHQFYGWLAKRHEIAFDPTAGVRAPTFQHEENVLTHRDLAALLGACADERTRGHHLDAGVFESRRDSAIVALFITTGLTAREMVSLATADVDLGALSIRVSGGRRDDRDVPILRHVADPIEKYLLVREGRSGAESIPLVWLGARGPLTQSGLAQMLARRSERGGIRRISPADFRRTFASDSLRRGLGVDEVAALGGWGSGIQLRPHSPG